MHSESNKQAGSMLDQMYPRRQFWSPDATLADYPELVVFAEPVPDETKLPDVLKHAALAFGESLNHGEPISLAGQFIAAPAVSPDALSRRPKTMETVWVDFIPDATGDREADRHTLAEIVPTLKPKAFSKYASTTLKQAKAKLETNLTRRLSGEETEPDPVMAQMICEPETFAALVTDLRTVKDTYIRPVGAAIDALPDSQLKAAIDLRYRFHREHINIELKGMYAPAFALANQARFATPETYAATYEAPLRTVAEKLPVIRQTLETIVGRELVDRPVEMAETDAPVDTAAADETVHQPDDYAGAGRRVAMILSRLDKFHHGAAPPAEREDAPDIPGARLPISDSLKLYFKSAMETAGDDGVDLTKPVYDMETAKNVRFNAAQMSELFTAFLKAEGLYSDYQEYDEHDDFYNKNPAPDGKWRVVITTKKDSLSAGSQNKTIKVPDTFDRALYEKEESGVLAVFEHELMHVFQAENAENLGIVSSGQVSFSRRLAWLESGGVRAGDEADLRLFGQKPEVSGKGYVAALEERLEGGTMTDGAERYYQAGAAKDTILPKAVKRSVDRMLRLYRGGGQWLEDTPYWSNSQPLDYAEQGMMAKVVPKKLEVLHAVGGAGLADLARLYSIGWFDLQDIRLPKQSPHDTVKPLIDEYIRQSQPESRHKAVFGRLARVGRNVIAQTNAAFKRKATD